METGGGAGSGRAAMPLLRNLKVALARLHCGLMHHHAWTGWTPAPHSACEEQRRCERCGAIDRREAHDWGAWEPLASGAICEHLKTCRACGQQVRHELHLWVRHDGWRHRCARCGADGAHYGPPHVNRCSGCGGDYRAPD